MKDFVRNIKKQNLEEKKKNVVLNKVATDKPQPKEEKKENK